MNKYEILFFIILIQLLRALFNKNNEGFKFLLLSFYIITIPFEFSWSIKNLNLNTFAGTIGTNLIITIPFILAIIFYPLSKKNIQSKLKYSKWTKAIVLLIIISLINPNNPSKFTTLIFTFFLLSHYLFFIYILKNLNQREIIKGIFDGFLLLCIAQFILAICFPLLNIKEVTTIFHAGADEWATRMDTRIGAVGTFVHPGNLALYITISSTFFLTCFLNNFKKNISLVIIILNIITLILTYSRTSYLVFIIDIFFVYFFIKNTRKNIFSISNILKFIIPIVGALIYVIFYSPLSNQFLQSDTNQMFVARMIHWLMGYQTFMSSPIIGVGLNAHLEYIYLHFDLFKGSVIDTFFWQNPIHNIHIIIIVETGLVGFILWIAFIFGNINKSKQDLAKKQNLILSASQVGLIIGISLYGITGWAPFSIGILPFILMISFFTIQFRNK